MTASEPALVFDTGPLRHFTLGGWLGVLKYLTRSHQAVVPESVEFELKAQSRTEAALSQVLDADWIHVDRSTDIAYLEAFAHYERLLVARDRNRGECGALALGKARGHQLVIDDRVAWNHARRDGLNCRGTLGLLCEAIRDRRLTVTMVEQFANDLLTGEYRLPFGQNGLREWADEQGLI